MNGTEGTDSTGGGDGYPTLLDWEIAEIRVASAGLSDRAKEFVRDKIREAFGQSGTSDQRKAEALAGGGNEPSDVVSEEEVRLKEGRGELISDEVPYVNALECSDGNFVVLWWRKASIRFEMDLVEAKYIHRLIGQEIEVLEYHEKKSKGGGLR